MAEVLVTCSSQKEGQNGTLQPAKRSEDSTKMALTRLISGSRPVPLRKLDGTRRHEMDFSGSQACFVQKKRRMCLNTCASTAQGGEICTAQLSTRTTFENQCLPGRQTARHASENRHSKKQARVLLVGPARQTNNSSSFMHSCCRSNTTFNCVQIHVATHV